MHSKYFEYIVVYLSVLMVCVLLGVIARIVIIQAGADEFTANTAFWIITAFGVIVYAALTLFIEGLLVATARKLFPKKERKEKEKNPTQNLETIRAKKQQALEIEKQRKIEIAIQYTQKEFATYISDKDMELLCQYVKLYAEQQDFNNIKSIKVKDLSTLDIYHYGWNIWKHFKVGRQERVSVFLKNIFSESLNEVEVNTIKRHLKDDEKKGIIKIRENL